MGIFLLYPSLTHLFAVTNSYFSIQMCSLTPFLLMTGRDKNYIYLATSDLLNELSKEGFKLNVSGLAVKWYDLFSFFVSYARVFPVFGLGASYLTPY